MNNSVSVDVLIRQLRAVGVCPGMILLVHSSLRAVGPVDGGASAVLTALQTVLGPTGTLLMPGFPSGSEYQFAVDGICFDAANTPSGCGYLTELFRRSPGTLRSLSPTHSLTGYGPEASSLLEGHERCQVTAGRGSPFEKLIERGGRILMLGATRSSNTMMHYLENTLGAPTLCARLFPTSVLTKSGQRLETPIYPHMPGLLRNYPRAIELLEKVPGGMVSGLVGQATCELYDCRLLQQIAAAELARNPCAFLKVFVSTREQIVPGPVCRNL